MLISLIGTIPGATTIGVLAIYPIRNIIAIRPLNLAIPIALYAAIIVTVLLGWTTEQRYAGKRHYEILWFYSASCGLGFVATLAWLAKANIKRPDFGALDP